MSSRIQSVEALTGGSASFASTITSGNCVAIFGGITEYTGTPSWSVTDDKGNSYPIKASFTGTDSFVHTVAGCVAFLENITNGPKTITLTISGVTGGNPYFFGDEWSGAATVSASDGAACQTLHTSGTDSMTSGSITTTADGDLILGGYGGYTVTAVAGTGFTLGLTDNVNDLYTESKTQTTHGVTAATFTPSAVNDALIFVIAIKPAVAPPPPSPFALSGSTLIFM